MEKIEVSSEKEQEKEEKKQNLSTKKQKKINKGPIKTIIFVILAFLVGSGAMYLYNVNNPTVVTKNRTFSETKVTEEAIEDAIAKVYDSVLCIEVLTANGDVASTGTGFVYDKDDKYGYVLTNAHVVSGGSKVQGTLSNNKVVELTVLGTDNYTDLAVLRMDVKDVIQVASIGKSENIKIGNTVFTVGSPMGSEFSGTVTKGILSGKDRLIETSTSTDIFGNKTDSYIVKVLQTDAAISPGNSGGPLVNLAGDVIGINSLKLVDEEVEGMGFAIPIEDAMLYIDALEQGKEIKRPVVGVQIIDMTNDYVLYKYNIDKPKNVNAGIVLMEVNSGYPAEEAGLEKGDIVTAINGEKITTVSEFKYELYKYSIGDTVEVTYYRGDKEYITKIKLSKTN